MTDFTSAVTGTSIPGPFIEFSTETAVRAPALITACVAINTCYEQFSDLNEQQALMEINSITTRETNYWPTSVSKAKLEEVWGWGT